MASRIIHLRTATPQDEALVLAMDRRLDPIEHVQLNRAEKLAKAILAEECWMILANEEAVGFALLDYRFFGRGWIELLVIEAPHRGQGIAPQVLDLICQRSNTSKVFTSTNRSNRAMQRALAKAGFAFAGELIGLDEGDPECFYFRTTAKGHYS